MQRRRQNQESLPVTNGPGAQYPSINSLGSSFSPSPKLDVIKLAIVSLVIILINAELLAYRVLVLQSVTTEAPTSEFSLESKSMTEHDSASVIVSRSKKYNINNNNPHFSQSYPRKVMKQIASFKRNEKIDKKQPATPTRAPSKKKTATYAPTTVRRLNRVQYFKHKELKNYNFWKTNYPDPVPPLPKDEDVNPSTGEKLPPIIAYVTTLTKCAPSNMDYLDGAAVLLHSIRRNSYGWAPMQQQLKENQQRKREQTTNHNLSNNFNPKSWPNYGGNGGRYRYRAYVILNPDASPKNEANKDNNSGDCAKILENMGYTVLHRPPLVPLYEIPPSNELAATNNTYYDELQKSGYVGEQRSIYGPLSRPHDERPDLLSYNMLNDGCCGYDELLKLHVYGMVEHGLAVHLDFDSLLLRPMDDLFDVMLGKTMMEDVKDQSPLPVAKGPHTKVPDFNKPIHAAFTRDYNSVKDPNPDAPVGIQGGFLVVKPSLEVLDRFKTILRRGEFLLDPRKGWGGKFGGFEGDMTFQGILPYYYEMVAPEGEHNEIELDRCIYNQMADNPRKSTHRFPRATPLDPEKMGFSDTTKCRDGREDCSDTDCQRVHPRDSVTAHFTFCHKPWDCSDGLPGTVAHETCSVLLREWYGVRRELEDWWLLKDPNFKRAKTWWDNIDDQRNLYWKAETVDQVYEHRSGSLNVSTYLGYCDSFGENGYRSLTHPDGWFEEQEKAVKKELKHQHKLENAINKPW